MSSEVAQEKTSPGYEAARDELVEVVRKLEAGGLSGWPNKDKFWVGEGCNFCAGTGYEGRVGVYELLRVTPEIKRLIVGWATQEEIRRMAISQGMRTLLQDALEKMFKGVVDYKQARAIAIK